MFKKNFVLDEEEFHANLEKIIQRCFYPNIQKQQNKLEWIEAIGVGDIKEIRRTQSNITARSFAHEINLETTNSTLISDHGSDAKSFDLKSKEETSLETLEPKLMMLDEFCAIFNGQYIEAFRNLMEREDKKLSINRSHQLNGFPKNKQIEKIKCLPIKWSNLAWHWIARNPLYYPSSNTSPPDNNKKPNIDGITRQINYRFYNSYHSKNEMDNKKSIYMRDKTGRENSRSEYRLIDHNTKITKALEMKTQVTKLKKIKTPYRLDSHDIIHVPLAKSEQMEFPRFTLKEPNKKEETARRLADKVTMKQLKHEKYQRRNIDFELKTQKKA